MADNHFHSRAKERGITETDTVLLAKELEYAHKNGRDDFLELALKGSPISCFRFRVKEGIFYALMSDTGRAVSVYTQDILRKKKWAKKKMAKGFARG